MDDKQILNEMSNTLSWGKETFHSRKTGLQQYSEFHKKSLNELLDEAYSEEDNHVPYHRLKIRDRINDFLKYLQEEGKSYSTIRSRYTSIVMFYKFYSVRLPEINLPSGKQFKNNPFQQLGFEDIITKEEIRKACDNADLQLKTIFLITASSGTAVKEINSLTIRHFTEGTTDYHHLERDDYESDKQYIEEVIKKLQKVDEPIVTQFDIIRSKVAKPYVTFVTDECSRSIIDLIKSKLLEKYDSEITLNTPLVTVNTNTRIKLKKLNDFLGLGKAGRYRKLNLHMLRRFFATTMSNPSNDELDDIMPDEYIDLFEGRSKGNMNKVYIKKDPKQLKKIYMKYMDKVIIYDDDLKKKVLEDKIEDLEEKVENYKVLDEKVNKIENLIRSNWSKSKSESLEDYI